MLNCGQLAPAPASRGDGKEEAIRVGDEGVESDLRRDLEEVSQKVRPGERALIHTIITLSLNEEEEV